jgi:hypothetical protein
LPERHFWTNQAYLAVFRVRGDILAMMIGAAPPLASRIAAPDPSLDVPSARQEM